MVTRTTRDTVVFSKPVVLAGLDEALPAGRYAIETDEDLLEGVSFPVWRRLTVYMQLHPRAGRPGLTQTLTISPSDLDEALERDRAST